MTSITSSWSAIEEAAEAAGYNLLMFSAAKSPSAAGPIYSKASTHCSSPTARCLVGTHERQGRESPDSAGEKYPFVIIAGAFPNAEVSTPARTTRRDRARQKRWQKRLGASEDRDGARRGDHESVLDRRAGFAQARRRAARRTSPVRTLEDDRQRVRFWPDLIELGRDRGDRRATEISYALRRACRPPRDRIRVSCRW